MGNHSRGTQNRGLPKDDLTTYQSTVDVDQSSITIEVDIVGHASPRWRSARTIEEAAQKNLSLSDDRTEVVKESLKRYLKNELKGFNIQFIFNESITYGPDQNINNLNLTSRSLGSQVTLREAQGNADANDDLFRRVDINIDLTTLKTHNISTPYLEDVIYRPLSKDWDISLFVQTGLDFGYVEMSAVFFELRNLSKEGKRKNIKAFGVIPMFFVGGKLSFTDVLTFSQIRSIAKLRKLGEKHKSFIRSLTKLDLFKLEVPLGDPIRFRTKWARWIEEFDDKMVTGSLLKGRAFSFGGTYGSLEILNLGQAKQDKEDVPLNTSGLSSAGTQIDPTVKLGAAIGRTYFLKRKTVFNKTLIRKKNSKGKGTGYGVLKHVVLFDTGKSTIKRSQDVELRRFAYQVADNVQSSLGI